MRHDPGQLAASGDAGEELSRRPFSNLHQLLMFCVAFFGILLQNSVSQYVSSQQIIFLFPTFLQLIVYVVISLVLMPFIYSRFAKVRSQTIIVHMGWAMVYGIFSRPVLTAIKDTVVDIGEGFAQFLN